MTRDGGGLRVGARNDGRVTKDFIFALITYPITRWVIGINKNPLYNIYIVDFCLSAMGGYFMSRIARVTPKDNHCLEVVMDNGNSVIIDFTSRLNTVRFSILSDQNYFNTVTTDGVFVRWNYKVEISVSEVFELVRK